jgi:predicted transposase/invertase (TIGR01784 family)
MKVLAQLYQNKSLAVYGLDIPKIKRMLPANYPTITATEYCGDNAFLLEDDTLYIQEYESVINPDEDFVKYTRYILPALEQLKQDGIKVKEVIIGVIYTSDVLEAPAIWDKGAITIKVKQVFLSKFDSDAIYADLKQKVSTKQKLTDEDMLKLIILPLTQPDKIQKQQLAENTINLAKQLPDEKQQIFAIAGILTATDKFINRSYSNQIREWIRMTKVARIFEEEKIEAVNEAIRKNSLEIAKNMLQNGFDRLEVMKCTGLTRSEIDKLQESLSA